MTATAAAADLGGAMLPLTGELDAVAPERRPALRSAASAASQTWDLHLTAAGQTLDIPMLVVAARAPEGSGLQTKLLVCLPPPDVPVGTPGRATVRREAPVGDVRCLGDHSASRNRRLPVDVVFTPYNPGKGTVNAAGTVETQAIRHIPTQVKLNYDARRR